MSFEHKKSRLLVDFYRFRASYNSLDYSLLLTTMRNLFIIDFFLAFPNCHYYFI